MKNARKEQAKSCLCLGIDDFRDDIRKIYGYQAEIIAELDGLTIQKNEEEIVEDEDLLVQLAQYYGLDEVTSVHIDDCDSVGVWIVYKIKPKKWTELKYGNGITVPIQKEFVCPLCHHCQSKKSRFCPYCGHPMRS